MASTVPEIEQRKCLHCGHEWFPMKPGEPKRCAAEGCKSPNWNKPPRNARPDLKGVPRSPKGVRRTKTPYVRVRPTNLKAAV